MSATTTSPSLVAVLGVGVLDDPTAAAVPATDLGFTRGDGCFEATRVSTDADGRSIVDHLEAHLARLARSATALDLTVDPEPWRRLVADAVDAWVVPGEAVLRLFLTAGAEADRGGRPAGVVAISPVSAATIAHRRGVRVVTLSTGRTIDAFADAPWLLGGVKTLSYAANMAAGRAAAARGADDALLVSVDGFALEAPRAALVWRQGDSLSTTEVEGTGVLHSITQRAVFAGATAAGVPTAYGRVPVAELSRLDGAWLLSSSRLVAPIVRIDDVATAVDPDWTDRLRRWTGTALL